MNIAKQLRALGTPASSSPGRFATFAWLGVMVLLWGLSWPATKIALESVPPLWLACFRFASAAVCLFAFVALRGGLRLPPKADWPIVASIAILQMTAFSGLGMIAMTHVDTTRAVLLAYTTPLWAMLLSGLMLRRAPSRLQLLALAVGLGGIALICSPLETDWQQPQALLGAGLLLTGAICWSVVIVHIRQHRWTASPLALAPWQMLIASVLLATFALAAEGSPAAITFSPSLLELLFFIGPVATSACFVISAEHGRRISTFAMSNCTLGVPVIGIAASVFFLGDVLSPLFITGLGLIMAGMVLAALTTRLEPGAQARPHSAERRVRH